jgi:DNA-binding MarR family transcriptional regulator
MGSETTVRSASSPFEVGHDARALESECSADKVAWAAESLAQLARQMRGLQTVLKPVSSNRQIRDVQHSISARRLRGQLFRADLFSDPGWNLLLELYGAEVEQYRICATDLYARADVPPTTGIRWIAILENCGFVVRREDPLDARRRFISLTPKTSLIMQDYFDRIATVAS